MCLIAVILETTDFAKETRFELAMCFAARTAVLGLGNETVLAFLLWPSSCAVNRKTHRMCRSAKCIDGSTVLHITPRLGCAWMMAVSAPPCRVPVRSYAGCKCSQRQWHVNTCSLTLSLVKEEMLLHTYIYCIKLVLASSSSFGPFHTSTISLYLSIPTPRSVQATNPYSPPLHSF